MSVISDCLTYAVGMTQTVCDCFGETPSDYQTSDSGLFLDELISINNADFLQQCEDETVFDTLVRTRTDAINRYKTDAKALLSKNHEQRYKHFSGKLGEAKGRVAQNFSNAFAGIALRCNPIKSGIIRIKAVGAIFNKTGTKHLYLMNNLGDVVSEIDINTVANVYTNNVLDNYIELPLYSENTEYLQYYLVYADDIIKPLNNEITCNSCTGFVPCWDMSGRCFGKNYKNDRFGWTKYVQLSGFTFNALADLYDIDCSYSSSLFGLTVDIEAFCSVDDMFCKEAVNYSSELIGSAQALAIRYKWAENIVNNEMLTDKLTRSNIINREALTASVVEWKAEYEKYLNFIVENIDIKKSGCLDCRDKYGMGVTSIIQ